MELVAHMCSIFGNMPPVFRRPAHMMPQYLQPAYNPNASSAGYQQQPSYLPQQQQHSNAASYQAGQFQSYPAQNDADTTLFGNPPYASRSSTTASVRVEDRSVALKVEITSKIQQELERMFSRIRGALAFESRVAFFALLCTVTDSTLVAQTTSTYNLSTSFS